MIYRRTRQISYNILHSLLRDKVSLDALFHVNFEKLMFDASAILDEYIGEDVALLRLMDGIDDYHAESTFASPEAASHVLGHIREFKEWCASENPIEDHHKISLLVTKPVNWPEVRSTNLARHFARLRLPAPQQSWLSEVRQWLVNEQRQDPWGGSNFLISPSPRRDGLLADMYEGESGIPTAAAIHVVKQLSRHYERTWSTAPSASARSLWRSSAVFLGKVFRANLNPGANVELEAIEAEDGHIGYAVVARSFEQAREPVRRFLERTTQSKRKDELQALLNYWEQQGAASSVWGCFLCRVQVLDRNGDRHGEIDGAIFYVEDERLKWVLIEEKRGRKGSGATQLEDNILSLIAAPRSEVDTTRIGGQRISHVTVTQVDGISSSGS